MGAALGAATGVRELDDARAVSLRAGFAGCEGRRKSDIVRLGTFTRDVCETAAPCFARDTHRAWHSVAVADVVAKGGIGRLRVPR
eukprot:1159493-Prymnesium_polylepis.1